MVGESALSMHLNAWKLAKDAGIPENLLMSMTNIENLREVFGFRFLNLDDLST